MQLPLNVVNLVWDGCIPDNRIYSQINTNWLFKCIHQSPWWIIYESTKLSLGRHFSLKQWLISMSCHPEEREKKRISGEWSPKINGNWISLDRTENWMERTVCGPGISSWQSLPVIEFTSTPFLSQLWFFSPPSNENGKVWLLKIIKHTHNWCESLEYSGRKTVRMKESLFTYLWVKSFF